MVVFARGGGTEGLSGINFGSNPPGGMGSPTSTIALRAPRSTILFVIEDPYCQHYHYQHNGSSSRPLETSYSSVHPTPSIHFRRLGINRHPQT